MYEKIFQSKEDLDAFYSDQRSPRCNLKEPEKYPATMLIMDKYDEIEGEDYIIGICTSDIPVKKPAQEYPANAKQV